MDTSTIPSREGIIPDIPNRQDYELKEAEWVSAELRDTVTQLNRHRNLYLTALAAAVVWVLGKVITDSSVEAGQTGDIEPLRENVTICLLVCVIPFINACYTLIALETNEHLHNLARYRELLGLHIGRGDQVWRWDAWRRSEAGSTFAWPTTVNISLGIVVVFATAIALWFVHPATGSSRPLELVWWSAVAAPFAALVFAIITGLRYVRLRNKPPTQAEWDHIRQYLKT